MPLMARRDAVFHTPKQDNLYQAAVKVLDREMVGLYLAVGAETFYASVSYEEIAEVTQDPAAAAMLRATHQFLRTDYPSWIRQTWDLGGCCNPGGAQKPIEGLAGSWADSPACLRDILRPHIEGSLKALAKSSCFCNDLPKVQAALDALAEPLKRLEAAGGPAQVKFEPGPNPKYSDSCSR